MSRRTFKGKGDKKLFFSEVHTVYVVSNKMHVYPVTGTLKGFVVGTVINLTRTNSSSYTIKSTPVVASHKGITHGQIITNINSKGMALLISVIDTAYSITVNNLGNIHILLLFPP